MAHDDGAGRGLSRVLREPVRRAMHRMRSAPRSVETTGDAGPPSGIVDCALYVDGVRQPGDWNYRDALAAARRTRNAFLWLGLKEPGADELADIADAFDLHELPVEDAVKSHQRPKVERYGDMTFVTLRTARYVEHAELTENSEVVESGDVMMFIGEHFIITVRHGDAARLAPVRAGLNDKHDLLKHGPWAVAYAVYDLVVDVLIEVSAAIEEDVAVVEDSVFAREGSGGRIQRIYQLKRELMEFKRAVLPLQRPLAGLATGQLADVPGEIRRYFRDVNDHLTRTVEQVMYFDELLNSILQARLAQVTVDQNNDMRKMAAWAGIAAFWTAVAGIYGMNFDYMPELRWKYGYAGVFALMVAVSFALYRAFRRSGWL
ncbi:magnesium and cobalt transport protein CorA [Planosporangium sp. 12N6]|uniref:magnesium and cobalt transport protein CorA n=1 Tax=Planosporangium spinosum TaxID=3402278 RepID=UPI003CE81187